MLYRKASSIPRLYLLFALSFLFVFGCSFTNHQAVSEQNGGPETSSEIAQNHENGAGAADDSAGEGDEDDDEDVAATPENGRGTIKLTESEQITQNILDTALELTESAQELWSRGETEKAIENLDNAYLLIAKVTAESGPRFTQSVAGEES